MKLLIDMNLSPRWAERLRAEGHDAIHWSSLGSWTASDRDILRFAHDNEFIVLTHDLDFGDILSATGGAKPSVVQIRASGLGVERIGQHLISALALCAEELAAGALVTVDAIRTRIHLLPLPFRHPL